MKFSSALRLALRHLSRTRRAALLSAFGVAMGTGCLVFFTALGQGVSELVRTRLLPVDDASLEVVPPQLSLGTFLGGGKLDEATLARLARLDGVVSAHPKMNVRVSAVSRYDGDFFGQRLRLGLEVMAVGVDPALVASDIPEGRPFTDPGEGKPIPILANTRLLEIYNKSFAVQRQLPQLSPELLSGFRIPLEWNRSFVSASTGRSDSVLLEFVGFSNKALLAGVTVPLEVARRINRTHGKDAETYSSIVLRASGPDRLPALAEEVRRMGFEIDDSEREAAEQAGFGILVVTLAFALLAALVTLLAAVNIAHAFWAAVRERRREIGILRAVGASGRDVLLSLLAEAALLGTLGTLVGVLAAVAASSAVDLAAASVLPDFPFKPESFFLYSPGIVLGAMAVGLVASMLGALGPARSAARMNPVQALAE